MLGLGRSQNPALPTSRYWLAPPVAQGRASGGDSWTSSPHCWRQRAVRQGRHPLPKQWLWENPWTLTPLLNHCGPSKAGAIYQGRKRDLPPTFSPKSLCRHHTLTP